MADDFDLSCALAGPWFCPLKTVHVSEFPGLLRVYGRESLERLQQLLFLLLLLLVDCWGPVGNTPVTKIGLSPSNLML